MSKAVDNGIEKKQRLERNIKADVPKDVQKPGIMGYGFAKSASKSHFVWVPLDRPSQ